jgi:polyhydroxybutyrate depolymerase
MKRLAAAVLVFSFTACNPTPPVSPDPNQDSGVIVTEMDAGTQDAGVTDAGSQQDAGAPDSGVTLDAGVDAGMYVPDPLIVARPYNNVVPVGYAASTPTPLVVLLHGYTASGATQEAYFRLTPVAQARTFLLALPDGTGPVGGQFWNATDACCAFGQNVDDVAYVTAVIRDMQARFNVDPKRIFLVGHSNGGFMSHRMACERSELIAGIVSLAGAVWNDPSRCTPTSPVNILQVHGTLDAVIAYNGGSAVVGQPPYPGAETTVATWAQKNNCTGSMLQSIGGNLDLAADVILSETEREAYMGCPAGAAAELWRIRGGSHVPVFNSDWGNTIYTWLMAHPKP